jgi:hypothetical protein
MTTCRAYLIDSEKCRRQTEMPSTCPECGAGPYDVCPKQTTDPTLGTNPRLDARIEAAADWLQSDDSAYEHDREAAIRAAREMLRVSDEVEAKFEAAYQRALATLKDYPDASNN